MLGRQSHYIISATWRETKGCAELCVSRNIHQQNHSLYELNMSVFRRKLNLPWRTGRTSTKSERCWLIVDTLNTHTPAHTQTQAHIRTEFHLKSLRHRVTWSCQPGLIALGASLMFSFAVSCFCMEVCHNYRAQKPPNNHCSAPIRYICVSSSL